MHWSPRTNSPSCMGAKNQLSQPYGAEPRGASNSSKKTTGTVSGFFFCSPAIFAKFAASESAFVIWVRFRGVIGNLTGPVARVFVISFTAYDFPLPGGPKTARHKGREGDFSSMYMPTRS